MSLELIIITVLLIKHFFADWVLQSDEIAKNKGTSYRFLAIHCLHHSMLTLMTLVFFVDVMSALTIAIAEFFVHGFIDWIKANPVIAKKFPFPTHSFWVAIGADQLAHQLFYVFLVYYVSILA